MRSVPRSSRMQRIKDSLRVLTLTAVLIHCLTGSANAEPPEAKALPSEEAATSAEETASLSDYMATNAVQSGQAAPNTSTLPQLQDSSPRPRRQGAPGTGANSPEFLRGLQLSDSGARAGRRSHQSLLAPAQFHGNVFGTSGSAAFRDTGDTKLADIPAAGGNARFSIADNNKPLPQNRVFFDYRHYNNAIGIDETRFGTPPISRRQDFDGFLFGLEKTLGDEQLASLDVRIPFSGNADVSFPDFQASGGEFGNIPVSWKQILILEETFSMVAGTTIIAPTGGDVTGQLRGTPFALNNEAWHLAPFLGGMVNPQLSDYQDGPDSFFSPLATDLMDRTTFQWFAAVDVPLNDQEVIVDNTAGGYRESTFVSLNTAAVLNLFSAPKADNLTRLDGSLELHYLKDVGGGDAFVSPPTGIGPMTISQSRVSEVLNLSAGLSAEIRRNTRIQIAAVAPLTSNNSPNNRAFDGELILSINRFF